MFALIGTMVIASQGPQAGEALLRLLRQNEAAIRSFDVTYKVEESLFIADADQEPGKPLQVTLREKPLKQHHLIRHVKQGPSERVEMLDSSAVAQEIRVLDSPFGVERLLYRKGNRGTISKPSATPVASCMDYRIPWLNCFGKLPTSFVADERKNLVESIPAGKDALAYRIPAAQKMNVGGMRFDVSLDLLRGGAVSEISVYLVARYPEPRLRFRHRVVEWLRLPEGAYVPVAIQSDTSIPDGNAMGKRGSSVTLTVDKARSNWNQPISPSLFTLDFPDGTNVADKIRNVNYTQGQAHPERQLDRLAMQASQVRRAEQAAAEAQRRSPIQSESLVAAAPWWRTSPAYVAYVVLLLAVGFVLIRRRQLAGE